jgi:hypothetical protein
MGWLAAAAAYGAAPSRHREATRRIPVHEPTSHDEFRPHRLPAVGDPQATCYRQRVGDRYAVRLPARLTWRDRRGATHLVNAVTRNVSKQGVYVECSSDVSIPLYRLVLFQVVRPARHYDWLPESLRRGAILSAVYRVTLPKSSNEPGGLALRLMVGSESDVEWRRTAVVE